MPGRTAAPISYNILLRKLCALCQHTPFKGRKRAAAAEGNKICKQRYIALRQLLINLIKKLMLKELHLDL